MERRASVKRKRLFPLKLWFYFALCDCEMSSSNQNIPDTVPSTLWGKDILYWLLQIPLALFCYIADSRIISLIILCHLRYILQYHCFPDLAFLLSVCFELIFPRCICRFPSWLSFCYSQPMFLFFLGPSFICLSWLLLAQPAIQLHLWISLPCLCFNSRLFMWILKKTTS